MRMLAYKEQVDINTSLESCLYVLLVNWLFELRATWQHGAVAKGHAA